MSYILDALKKAEQTRARGKAPDLFDVQAHAAALPARPMWPWVVALLLGANVVAFYVWMQVRPQAGELATVQVLPPADAEATAPPSLAEADIAASVPPVSGEDNPSSTELAAAQAAKAAAKARQNQAVEKKPAAQRGEATVSAAKAEPQDISDQSAPRRAPNSAMASPVTTPVTPPAPVDAAPAADVVKSAESPLLLGALPPAVQAEVPKMAVAMHMYSGNPANRLVNVNDRALREGDELMPGLRLVEITPDGMIFTYRNYRFRKPLK